MQKLEEGGLVREVMVKVKMSSGHILKEEPVGSAGGLDVGERGGFNDDMKIFFLAQATESINQT